MLSRIGCRDGVPRRSTLNMPGTDLKCAWFAPPNGQGPGLSRSAGTCLMGTCSTSHRPLDERNRASRQPRRRPTGVRATFLIIDVIVKAYLMSWKHQARRSFEYL